MSWIAVPSFFPFPHVTFSYSDIIIEREILMQKYIHLVQIMDTEKIAANQLRTQLEDQDTEIERLKAEVCMTASASACACVHKSTYCRAHVHVHLHLDALSDGAHANVSGMMGKHLSLEHMFLLNESTAGHHYFLIMQWDICCFEPLKCCHEYLIPCAGKFTLRLLCQIVVLNKTKERIRPYQNNQEEEDPDIKKIKKVKLLIIAH